MRALGLSQCPGVLRMILLPDHGAAKVTAPAPEPAQAVSAAVASLTELAAALPAGAETVSHCGGGHQSRHTCWVPLSVSQGLPLHCLPLCRSVCARALASGFLSSGGQVVMIGSPLLSPET